MSKSIIFAVYKDDVLQGYRQDTFGTLGLNGAKIYTYSKEQIQTVLKNICSNLNEKSRLGDFLGSKTIANAEKEIHEKVKNMCGFEVRVLEGPVKYYDRNFNVKTAQWEEDQFPHYKTEEIQQILNNPENQKIIETHKFALNSELVEN